MLAGARTLIAQDALPCSVVFAVIVWLLVSYHRRAGDVPAPPPGIRAVISTILGGYVVFLSLTVGISLLAGESGDYVEDAVVGGTVLVVGIVVPLAAIAIWVKGRRSTGAPGR